MVKFYAVAMNGDLHIVEAANMLFAVRDLTEAGIEVKIILEVPRNNLTRESLGLK